MTESRPKRRWYQFSLRTLLIGVLVVSLPLSWVACRMQKRRKQREAVTAIVKAGGKVSYDYDRIAEPCIPKWARALLGDSFFYDVKSVVAYGSFGDDEASHLKELTNLTALYLTATQVTDAGLECLEGSTKLTTLDLNYTQVTDAGLEHIEGLKNLRYLSLCGTQITDAGLENLKGLTDLTGVDLDRTQITDNGLEHLEGLTNLRHLNLRWTQVTPEGVRKLRNALPGCQAFHDK